MFGRIWQWLVQQFRRFFGSSRKSPTVEQAPPRKIKRLSDAEYENFFMQLLEGVNENWQAPEVARFFKALSDRVTEQQWLDWLGRFGQRLESATKANHKLGRRLVRLGEVGEGHICRAAKLLGDRLLEMEPVEGTGIPKADDVDGWFERGKEKMDEEDSDEALAAFDRVLELDPNHHRAWINRGNALTNLERFTEAISCYDRAIEINPNAELAWSNRGDTLYDLERYEEAIASWDNALELDPTDAETWYNKGLTLAINLGRLEESLTCWEKSLELNPNDAQTWLNHGIALAELNRWEEAIASWDKATDLKPDLREAWINKGKALQKLGKYAEAIDANNRAIGLGTINLGAE